MTTLAELYETLPEGWLSLNETALLHWHALQTSGPILEVGCYRGRSSVLLASFGRPLYCVDPFDRVDTKDDGPIIEASWRENLKDRENVFLFKQPVENFCPTKVGFAYLDGDHSYQGTVNQIIMAFLCSAPVIAIHDVNDSGGGLEVKRAAIEYLGPWHERVERLAIWLR